MAEVIGVRFKEVGKVYFALMLKSAQINSVNQQSSTNMKAESMV